MLCLASILGIYLAAALFPGVHYEGVAGLLGSGIILALVLVVFRPVIMLIALPLNLLTVGLFSLIINAWMLQITDLFSGGIQVAGFWVALGTAVIILVLDGILKRLIPSRYRLESFQAGR
jgi:putative membrane protein